MNLDDFIITCFCLIDDVLPSILKGKRLRTRGPMPKLTDSEVITMEVVGSYLGFSQDKALYDYFCRHYRHFFPALARLHRTTFIRQAANLWALKERLWCHLRDKVISYDPTLAIVDSLPLPVCRFARSSRCVRFRGLVAYGRDHSGKQTIYGFRLHVRLCWPGLITQAFLAPANEQDFEMAPVLIEGTCGVALGDRNYWVPLIQEDMRRSGVIVLAPYRRASSPKSKATESKVLGRVRYLVDTVFGQLTDRCGIKRLWTRDLWHLRNQVLRAILMHTIGFLFNQQDETPLLQLERLVA
jgi:Transposase DDE domain